MGGTRECNNLMRIFDIINSFVYWGKVIKSSEIPRFKLYIAEMLRRNRVMIVNGDDGMECLLCYFITDNIAKFSNRPMWSTPEDSQEAKTIFIDKMVARKWDKSLREAVKTAINEKFPFVEEAHWLREPNNRHVIINIRRTDVIYS